MANPFPFSSGSVLTAAELNAIGDAETFTPSWTNLTPGNGTTDAKYWRVNDLVFWRVELVFGSTTSITGAVLIDYPVASTGTWLNAIGGQIVLDDLSSTDYWGNLYRETSTSARLAVGNVAGTYLTHNSVTATVPFTWTTGDRILIEDWYTIQ